MPTRTSFFVESERVVSSGILIGDQMPRPELRWIPRHPLFWQWIPPSQHCSSTLEMTTSFEPSLDTGELVLTIVPHAFRASLLVSPFHLLARCAAAIFRRADADIVRLPGLGPFAIRTTFCARTFAQRSFWAAAIFLRADAESVLRVPAWSFPPFILPRTESAGSTCFRSFARFVLCSLNCETTDTESLATQCSLEGR